MSELDRRHYRLILEIDRRGTISAAARALHITQSAASQQIREAERRIGFALTRRVGRSIELTTAARRLVAAAEVGERVWSEAEADARWLASASGATCKIALGVYDDVGWLGALQSELDLLDGTAPIELVRARDTYGFELLADGGAHVVIAPIDRPAISRRTVDLGRDRLVAVVSHQHPLATRGSLEPSDFDGTRYATFSTTPEDGFEYESFLGPAGVTPAQITRVESITAIVDLVAATDRITILCSRGIPNRPDIAAIPLTPHPHRPTWTLTISEADLDPTVERTIDLIAADRLRAA